MSPIKPIRVAINGFGRIGRYTAKLILSHPSIELVAINDLADNASLVHLLKYDSIHGKFEKDLALEDGKLKVGEKEIRLLTQSNPELLPWAELNVDIVIESTGRFTSRESANKHIQAGARKVIISAPATDPSIKMVVLGVNDSILTGDEKIISNASCTTNCTAPVMNLLHKHLNIIKAGLTTIHAVTISQNIVGHFHNVGMKRVC